MCRGYCGAGWDGRMAEEVCLDRVGGLSQNPRLFKVARPEDKMSLSRW
jgi:hypothetical protein